MEFIWIDMGFYIIKKLFRMGEKEREGKKRERDKKTRSGMRWPAGGTAPSPGPQGPGATTPLLFQAHV